MKTAGIVAEFDPFHKGHEYLINELRSQGYTHNIAVMSGNFTQRGQFAIAEKRIRTRAALLSGVDLVLEIPAPFAVGSAQKFALGACTVLNSLGCIDALAFGCECADIEQLEKAASVLGSSACSERTADLLGTGISYVSAQSQAVEELAGSQTAEIISQPNNILAIEYIKACKSIGSTMKFIPVARKGAGHDSTDAADGFLSASAIRQGIMSDDNSVYDYMPEASAEIYRNAVFDRRAPSVQAYADRIVLARLRTMTAEQIAQAPDISEGLENRIYHALKSAASLSELYDLVKSKRYTHSRIRRIIISLFLGITAEDAKIPVPYIRVLGFDKDGQEILKPAKFVASLPIVIRPSQIDDLSADARRIGAIEQRATDLYNLCTPSVLPCSEQIAEHLVII